MKLQMSPSRELVLRTIRKRPEITIGRIAFATGLSETAVSKHIAQLVSDDMIYPVKLAQKPGRLRTSMKGYRYGEDPAPVGSRKEPIPKHWDVLAHFFGRIAAEPAAA